MQQIGELGGSARNGAKAKTSRENGRRGGHPKDKRLHSLRSASRRLCARCGRKWRAAFCPPKWRRL